MAPIPKPMDSTGFAGLVGALAGAYTVVTYDPRGIGRRTALGTFSGADGRVLDRVLTETT